MTKPATGDGELFIHLDVAGLAALMKAVETAMADGRGQVALRSGGGMIVSGGRSDRFARVTVTFADPADPPDDEAWRSGQPDPEPEPRLPVLALQD